MEVRAEGSSMSPLRALQQELADVLDEASVRGKTSFESASRLREMPAAWKSARGSDKGLALIAEAQGVVGMLNSSLDADPLRQRTFEQLLQLKRSWRALLDELP